MVCCGKQSCCTGNILQKSAANYPALRVDRGLAWVDVVGLFPAPRECLAAFSAVAAAEVLSGAKPANMIRIPNQRLPCDRRMYRLWQKSDTGLPHEVGMFLENPLKDVKGFMEQRTNPSHGRGLWLSNFYQSKRQKMIAKLATVSKRYQLLLVA